jgi:hypothetical protein
MEIEEKQFKEEHKYEKEILAKQDLKEIKETVVVPLF